MIVSEAEPSDADYSGAGDATVLQVGEVTARVWSADGIRDIRFSDGVVSVYITGEDGMLTDEILKQAIEALSNDLP